jgi:hypothetical protein
MIVSHVASAIQMARLSSGAKAARPAPHAHSPSAGTQTTQLQSPSWTCRPRTTLRYERQAIESRSVGRAVVARMIPLRANLVPARASWEENETTTSHSKIVTAAASCVLVSFYRTSCQAISSRTYIRQREQHGELLCRFQARTLRLSSRVSRIRSRGEEQRQEGAEEGVTRAGEPGFRSLSSSAVPYQLKGTEARGLTPSTRPQW